MDIINLKKCEVADIVSQQISITPKEILKVFRTSWLDIVQSGLNTIATINDFKQGALDITKTNTSEAISQDLFFGNVSIVVGLGSYTIVTRSGDHGVKIKNKIINSHNGEVYDSNDLVVVQYGGGVGAVYEGPQLPTAGFFDRFPYYDTGLNVLCPYLPIDIDMDALSTIVTRITFYFQGWQLITS